GELGGRQLVVAAGERGLDVGPRLVGGSADGPALERRQLPDAAEDRRQLGATAQVADARLLQRRGIARGSDRRQRLVADRRDLLFRGLRHGGPSYVPARTARP